MLSFQKFCVYGGGGQKVLQSLVTFCPLPFVQTKSPIENTTEPPAVRASEERLSNGDIYLLENGLNLFLWVGASVQQGVVQSLFGVSSFSQITSGLVRAGRQGECGCGSRLRDESRSQ